MPIVAIVVALVYVVCAQYTENLKYILVWSPENVPLPSLGNGDEAFVFSECEVSDCYVTSNRSYFDNGLTEFDAIAFSGKMLDNEDVPSARYSHQKYIFFSSEPSSLRPICNRQFDGFFNWTATYKLDSDIPWTYFDIAENTRKETVGPQFKMNWRESSGSISDALRNKISKKSKAVAWFSTHLCSSPSGRENHALSLHAEMLKLGLRVDVYGGCGTLVCRSKQDCLSKLETDYFFYLAMESSIDEDYVTQELLLALKHDIVPIVFGGANYSFFLPPGSYLDARESPSNLAQKIRQLMRSPEHYARYLRWKQFYTYKLPANVCRLCAALHNDYLMTELSIYQDFRFWWHPKYNDYCKWYNFQSRVKSFFG